MCERMKSKANIKDKNKKRKEKKIVGNASERCSLARPSNQFTACVAHGAKKQTAIGLRLLCKNNNLTFGRSCSHSVSLRRSVFGG